MLRLGISQEINWDFFFNSTMKLEYVFDWSNFSLNYISPLGFRVAIAGPLKREVQLFITEEYGQDVLVLWTFQAWLWNSHIKTYSTPDNTQDVVLIFRETCVPNCAVPHVWFVGEAVSPQAALGRLLSAPTSLNLFDRQVSSTWTSPGHLILWQMLKFCRIHTFTCKSSYFQKKKISACLLQSLCCPHGRCPALLKSELPTVRALQGTWASQTLHTLPPVITAREAALALSVTSPVTDSSICHFSTIKTLRVFTYSIFALLQDHFL